MRQARGSRDHRRSLVVVLATALLSCATHAQAEAEQAPLRVLVLDFTATGVDEDTAALVGRVVAAEVARRSELEVLSADDLRRAMALEGEKQKIDCVTDSCLAEIAGALGAQLVIFGDVGALGDQLVLTLTLFDAHAAATRHRVSRVAPRDDVVAAAEAAGGEIARELSDGASLWVYGGAATLAVGGLVTAASGAVLGAALWTRGQASSTGAEKDLASSALLPAGVALAAGGAIVLLGTTLLVVGVSD
jgi:hypothetical protein